MRLKLSYLCCLVALGISTSSFAASTSSNTTSTGTSTNTMSSAVSSQDDCSSISESVNESLQKQWKAILPKDKDDNVMSAVKESKAMDVNNQTVSTKTMSIKDLFSNPFDYVKKAATSLYDKALEVGQNYLKSAYANAIGSVTSYVNNMYAQQLGKIASKMGSVGGPLLTNSLGQFVPNITDHLSGCATTLSSACLSQTMDKISQGAMDAATRAENEANYTIQQKTTEALNNATNKANSAINDSLNKLK